MQAISYSVFRQSLAQVLDQVNDDSTPVQITRKGKKGAVVVSLDDWDSLQETLYVLQNRSLSQQIESALQTHQSRSGRTADQDIMDEITGI